jgi:ribonuclease BN (tRNA processing enzyme)
VTVPPPVPPRPKAHRRPSMELVVLGSGTAVPHPRRGSAGYLLRGGGVTVIVDTGLGTLQKLARLGVSLAEPDAVAYTHLHLDHTAELAPMLFALKNVGIGRRKPLAICGGPGFRDFFGKLARMYGTWVEPQGFPLAVEEVPDGTVPLGPWLLTAVPVRHTPQSVAWRIEDPGTGKVVAFSGDTDVCRGLVEAARNADVAIFECSFPNERKVEGHLTPGEAGRAASLAGARRLVLTHFYPECEGADILGQSRETYGGEVILARDLMRIPI